MNTKEDHDLRQEFQRLRQEELAAVPSFERTVAAARRKGADPARPRRWSLGFAVPLVAAAAFALWWVGALETPIATKPGTEVALGWDMPTDYLLDGPGYDLLDTTPDLGDSDVYDIELTTDLEPHADSSADGAWRYA